MRIILFLLGVWASGPAFAVSAYEECAASARISKSSLNDCMTQRLLLGRLAPVKTRQVLPNHWTNALAPPLVLQRQWSDSLSLGTLCQRAKPALCWAERPGRTALRLEDKAGTVIILKGQLERTFQYRCAELEPQVVEQLATSPAWKLAGHVARLTELPSLKKLMDDYCVNQ